MPPCAVNGLAEIGAVVDAVNRLAAAGTLGRHDAPARADRASGSSWWATASRRRRSAPPCGGWRRGGRSSSRRPGAWAAFGEGLAEALRAGGWPVETILLPAGEEAKRLPVIEDAARELARRRVERREPLIAVGGGALGDPAGFLAATYLRGVPWIGVPTTLVAQVDSSIGGKTGVDLPEGKNLLGAFHHPAAIVLDIAALRSLPERQRRAALGEIVKMAALGDEALFATLETDGEAVAAGTADAFASGVMAEVVERPAWAKVTVVAADERESGAAGGRITLNLGHTVAHALEAVDGYANLLHGEAVAYGTRAAVRIGVSMGVTPPARAARIEATAGPAGPGGRAAPLPARGGARGDGDGQEARRRAAALGAADRRRDHGPRRRRPRRPWPWPSGACSRGR